MSFCVAIFFALYSALSAFFISDIGTPGRASAMAKILVLSGHLRASSLRVMMSFIVLYTFVSIVPAVELNHRKPLPATAVFPCCQSRASDRVKRALSAATDSNRVRKLYLTTPGCRRGAGLSRLSVLAALPRNNHLPLILTMKK